jgi:hypothetical protein
MKKSSIFLFIVLYMASVGVPVAWASMTITEVMYNPAGSDTGREWVELYNSGSESVEMGAGQKGWRIHDGANHVFADAVVVPPGGFVLVTSNLATFRAQYGNTLSVVKSALSLNNTSGTLSLVDADGKTVDTVSYTKSLGAFEDGMSLHRVGTTFAPGVPNPGSAPMPGVPKQAPVVAAKSVQKVETKQAATQQPAQVAGKSDLPAAAAIHVNVGESDSPVALQKQGGFLWHYLLALAALIVLGVVSVWYVRAEAGVKQPETRDLSDEFDIE